MGIRNDWWHKEFTKGDPAAQMGGGDGREGVPHPTHTWFTNHVPEGSSVLDVGCCNAHTLESFQRAGKKVIYYGVDHLQQLVDWCKEYLPNGTFSQSDAADLQDFEDNTFDYVLSRHVWEHLNHYSQHLMEMWRVAKQEIVVVGFLELKPDFDRLQYGADGLPHWYNQYGKSQVEQFIEYNMKGATYEWIDDFKDIGHPVLIIRKSHED
jgi:ubiquinone/menaquinone biosynthesis C-methylase UbiE